MSSKFTSRFRCIDAVAVIGLLMLTVTVGQTVELNPAAVIYKLPDQIEWKGTGGNRNAVLVGDPEKPGLYIVINKWLAGNNFSRPHFHPNDRFITVLKGTWWVGTGNKFDPANTVPMPAGSFATHFGKQVHWDGAHNQENRVLLLGRGSRDKHAGGRSEVAVSATARRNRRGHRKISLLRCISAQRPMSAFGGQSGLVLTKA